MNQKTTRLLALLGGLLLAGCHHADPDPNPGGCQFAFGYGSQNFTYTYNAAGQLTKARTNTILGELRYDYTYAGFQVQLPVTYDQNSYWNYWTLTLNTQGYLVKAVNTYVPGSQVKQQITFGYDTDGHLTGYHSDSYMLGKPSPPVESRRLRFDYQNGDLTQMFDTLTNSLTVITASPQANRLRIPLLFENEGLSLFSIDRGLLPFLGKPTTHLIGSLRVVQPANPYPYSRTYAYSLDGNGQVAQATISNGYSYTISSTCP